MKFISHTLLLIIIAGLLFACNSNRGSQFNIWKEDNTGPQLFVIWENNKAGFIDKDGKIVIAPRFYAANDFSEGLANVREHGYYGYINSDGKYEIPPVFEFAEPFHNGMAVAYKGDKGYYIQRDGKVAFKRPFTDPQPFDQYGCAIIGSAKRLQGMIDLSGRLVLDTLYERIYPNNNRFIVETGRLTGLADPTGRFIVPLGRYAAISALDDNYYEVMTEDGKSSVIDANGKQHFGAGRYQDEKTLPPVLESYDPNGFTGGILRGTIKGKLALVDTTGRIIWRDSSLPRCTPVNIDYQGGSYMYVQPKDGRRDIPGDTSRPIVQPNVPRQQLSIVIDVSKKDTFLQVYQGYNVYVFNTTGEPVKFSLQDYCLYCTMQALNSANEWKDIENIPSSSCGNSYGSTFLPPNEYWLLKCPVYEGSIKTKLRLALKVNYAAPPVYSNAIEGSVNPAQFWRKKFYFSGNIMDPYEER
ncbi:WG containing repeat-containing protein [Chitinophaga terrae (ex Kim and Jung 2007)]|uniref:WG containing repeat-containing protein n=1 Tax=Chitinophaga terrae (ex Kim and Jung 2007) TaxID=408074 RepID=A0A1H4CIT3_9BACT|nr:WG repeat-containing protein [Chitinophaga terrae (ex Kim and Jung 2007)]GEP89003.1 hypothetical protein CTE07_06480 [Chitinophaga terrae (ex Kim and Jung 2007)]SEA60244.1 WG containing repeat-containing protein [Chitinophaga terrae (ex Kim and Jung 2007)]